MTAKEMVRYCIYSMYTMLYCLTNIKLLTFPGFLIDIHRHVKGKNLKVSI